MNFEQFFENPKNYINHLIQVSDVRPDFGLKDQLDQVFNGNPDIINKVPIISTTGHLNMTKPGSLVRLRCVYVTFVTHELIHLRAHHQGVYYSPIIHSEFPEGCQLVDEDKIEMRYVYLFSSVPSLSPWLISEMTPDLVEDDKTNIGNLNLEELQKIDPRQMFEEPFQINVKFLHGIPEKPGVIYDIVGFITDPEPFYQDVDFELGNDIYSTIPTFVGLTYCEVKSLYNPLISSPEPSLSEIRAHIINIFTSVLEPIQAEILLLWMVGNVKVRKDEILLGLFSLNFFGATPEIANSLIHFFKFILTSVENVTLTCESLNSINLRPTIENMEFKSTPLSAPNNTKLIIDETKLSVGHFNEVGVKNLQILQQVIDDQSIDYQIECSPIKIFLSFPTLIISTSRSLLNTQMYYPIGNINQTNLNVDPALLALIRKYLENIKNFDYVMSEEDGQLVQQELTEILKSDKNIQQNDLHLLMILNQLNCISAGDSKITKERWDQSVFLFKSLYQYRKQ